MYTNGKTLKSILAEREVERMIALKLQSDCFKNTGLLYTAAQAVADSQNASLRLTATIDTTGSLVWIK